MAAHSRAELSQQREKNPRFSLNFLSSFPQSTPRNGNSTNGPTTADVLEPKGNFGNFGTSAAPLSRFVVRLNPLVYLHSYDGDEGSWPTTKLDQAKLFASFDVAQGIADLLHGDIRRVIVTGLQILLALTDRRC